MGGLWRAKWFEGSCDTVSSDLICQRFHTSDKSRINKKIRAKWLRGEAATKHVNSRQPTESKLSTSQTGKTKSLDLGTIEISSESGDDFESLEPASVDPLPSSALVVSSPTRIQKGKKCSRDLQDVLELSSSDEGDELPKKKIRCSSVIILDD